MQTLAELIDACMEDLHKKFWIWECVADNLLTPEQISSRLKWKDTPLFGKSIKGSITSTLLENYEMLTALVMSLDHMIKEMPNLPMDYRYVDLVFQEIKKTQ